MTSIVGVGAGFLTKADFIIGLVDFQTFIQETADLRGFRQIGQAVVEKRNAVVERIESITAVGFHLGEPFHGDDGLLL